MSLLPGWGIGDGEKFQPTLSVEVGGKTPCAEISGRTGLVAKPLFYLKAFHLKCLKTCTPKTQLTERTRARTGVRSAAWFFKSLSFCTIEKICLSR